MSSLAVKKERCYVHVVPGVQGLSLCGWNAKGQFEEAGGWLPGKMWEDEVQSSLIPGGAALNAVLGIGFYTGNTLHFYT